MVRATKVVPTFGVPDMSEACAFYTEKLGFKLEWTWGDPPAHVALSLGEVEIHLNSGDLGSSERFWVYFVVDDVDAMYRQCVESGVETRGEPEDQPWAMREFSIVDLNGYRLVFGQGTE